jgi:methyltransferase (TIGR00027 family)
VRDDTPSLTAMYVAWARAVASEEPELSQACRDPLAAELLPWPLRRLLHWTQRRPRRPLLLTAYRKLSFGLVDHLALRTAIIDHALEAQVAAGTRQVVLLGAGLDARAHRMAALADCTVFEVDHPSTQGFKLRRARTLPAPVCTLRYVACDFQGTALERTLMAQGFDAARPSVWLWEGVTMYLEQAAVDHSLATIAHLSAPSSALIATYVTPKVTAGPMPLARIGLAALALASEPVRTASTPDHMAQRLAQAGFVVQRDVLPCAVAHEFGVHPGSGRWAAPDEHVVAALKQ